MANPKFQDNPLGWRGVSARYAQQLGRQTRLRNSESGEKLRYGWFTSYRGDAATLDLLIKPRLQRMAKAPQPMFGGDVQNVRANNGRNGQG